MVKEEKETSPIYKLLKYIQPFKTRFYLAMTSSILNKVLDLMPPLLVAWIIDTLKGTPPLWIEGIIGQGNTWEKSIFLASLALIIFGLESMFQWGYQYGFLSLAQKVQHHLRIECYNTLQHKEYAYFENHRLGSTIAIVNDDINQLERFLNTIFNEFLQLLVIITFSIIILFKTNIVLAMFCLLPIPIIIIGSSGYQKKISPLYKTIRENVSELNNRLENNLSGIMVIKSFTAENFELKRVSKASENYAKANLKAIKYQSLYVPIIRLCIAIGFSGVLLIGAYWILKDTGHITLGELVLFSMLVQRLLWPLTRLGAMLDELERARASAGRIFNILKGEKKSIKEEEKKQTIPIKGDIKLENIYFSYNKDINILKNLTLEIKAGQTIGIAGTTGCGKSTLIKCLLRLYDIQKGAIYIDKKNINELSLYNLRQKISLVSQDIYLFHGTIRENIAYGKQNAKLEEIIKVAKLAELDSFIQKLPEKYNSIIGERGIKLSGGQRQRLSIARCLLKESEVIIFDEATSSVDTETEKCIQKNLLKFTKNKTAIIIAHRLSTIRQADNIYILKNGQIIENGKHEELIKLNKEYAKLWRIQIGKGHELS
ncbi:MAG: ABC transporter ATP-binding protein [bacterium]